MGVIFPLVLILLCMTANLHISHETRQEKMNRESAFLLFDCLFVQHTNDSLIYTKHIHTFINALNICECLVNRHIRAYINEWIKKMPCKETKYTIFYGIWVFLEAKTFLNYVLGGLWSELKIWIKRVNAVTVRALFIYLDKYLVFFLQNKYFSRNVLEI